jgi:hypothetical protein
VAKPPDGKQAHREERARGAREPLEPLVRLIAQVLAREHLAVCIRQAKGEDQSDSTDLGRTKDE